MKKPRPKRLQRSTITIRMPLPFRSAIKKLAREQGCYESEVIVKLLENALEAAGALQ